MRISLDFEWISNVYCAYLLSYLYIIKRNEITPKNSIFSVIITSLVFFIYLYFGIILDDGTHKKVIKKIRLISREGEINLKNWHSHKCPYIAWYRTPYIFCLEWNGTSIFLFYEWKNGKLAPRFPIQLFKGLENKNQSPPNCF